MKNLKKIILTMAMTMVLGTSAFAASGFEFLLQVAGGINYGVANKEAKDSLDVKGLLGYDVGVDAQIGYMFQVKDGFGISVLGELGYSWDAYRMGNGVSSSGGGYSVSDGLEIWQNYHSFKLGLLPKFNIGVGKGAIAIGIGGGVKIPMVGEESMTIYVSEIGPDGQGTTKNETILKRKDITDLYSPSVIGYMKVTFDYYLFFTDNIAMNFGLYLGGDFGMKYKETPKIANNPFDFGIQIGFRFGPKA